MTIKQKEKRNAILYAHVKPSLKKWIQKTYKDKGYSTLSEFVDDLLTDIKNKAKK